MTRVITDLHGLSHANVTKVIRNGPTLWDFRTFSREGSSPGPKASDAEAGEGSCAGAACVAQQSRSVENKKMPYSLDFFFVTFFCVMTKESK
jgi:hypothetical protein